MLSVNGFSNRYGWCSRLGRGFGPSGKIHQAGLIDLSTDLPLVVEFFDDPARIATTLEHIREIIDPGHIVTWQATLVDSE